MAYFKNSYQGHIDDLRNMIMELGDHDRNLQFKAYMEEKAKNASGEEKKDAADLLKSYFHDVLVLQEHMESFLQNADRLKEIATKDPERITDEEERILERAEEDVRKLSEKVTALSGMTNAMTAYNEADGYSELQGNTLVQEMFLRIESISSLSVKKSMVETKVNQSGLRDRVIENGIMTNELTIELSEYNEIKKKDKYGLAYLTFDHEQAGKKIPELETELKQLQNPKTAELYRANYADAKGRKEEAENELKYLEENFENQKTRAAWLEDAIKRLEEFGREEEDYLVSLKESEIHHVDREKAYKEATANREKVEMDFENATAKDVLCNMTGSEKNVRAYYDRIMLFKKWEKTYADFNAFLDKYKDNTDVMICNFSKHKEVVEKIRIQTPGEIGQNIKDAKEQMTQILRWCPQKEIFRTSDEGGYKELAEDILQKIKDAMDASEKAYKEDPSYVCTININHMTDKRMDLDDELLKGGYAVDFTGLAKFFLSVKAKPSDNVDEFTTEKIQKLNIRASVDASATAEVNSNVDYEYVMTREEQAAAKKAAKATLPQAPKADGEDSGSTGDGNDSRSPKWAIFG